jgi:hypothetical protein
MNKLYAVVLWTSENNVYSSVRISKILYDQSVYLTADSLNGYTFDIQLSKSSESTHQGKVIQTGKIFFQLYNYNLCL